MNVKLIQTYIRASSVSLIAKIVVSLSGLGVLFVLNQMLDKGGFGLFMLALSVCLLVAMVVSGFFCSLIMYHVSRGDFEKKSVEISLFWGTVSGLVVATGLLTAAEPLAEAMGKPEMVGWLGGLVWVIPAYSLNFILTSFYRAQQKVETMLVFQEIVPGILKVGFPVLIWVLGMPVAYLGWAFVLSFGVPFLVLYLRAPVRVRVRLDTLSWWDVRYSGVIAVNQIVNKSTRNLLTVFIGFFGSAAVVAELVVAMRVAQFLLIPKLMLAQLHVPRIGAKLAEGDRDGLMSEFNHVRSVSLGLTVLGSAVFVVLGGFILTVFGDYGAAYPLLLLLAVASVVRAGFGDIGGFVSMSGRSFAGFCANITSLAVMVAGLALFVEPFGAFGAGFALVGAAVVNMVGLAWVLWRFDGFQTVRLAPLIVILGCGGALLALAVQGYGYG